MTNEDFFKKNALIDSPINANNIRGKMTPIYYLRK